MGEEQRDDANGMDRQAKRPRPAPQDQPEREAPKRHGHAEFEIEKPPGEGQRVQEKQREEAAQFKAALDREFQGDGAADQQHLRAGEEKAHRELHIDEPRQPGHDEVDREIWIKRPVHLIIGRMPAGAVVRQNIHAGEMVAVIQHRRYRCREDKRKRQSGQQDEGGDIAAAGAPYGLRRRADHRPILSPRAHAHSSSSRGKLSRHSLSK